MEQHKKGVNDSYIYEFEKREEFVKVIEETVSKIKREYKISRTKLCSEIIQMNEATLRSLLKVKQGIKEEMVCNCYKIYMLIDGNTKEKYCDYFLDPEEVASLIEDIDTAAYRENLNKLSKSKRKTKEKNVESCYAENQKSSEIKDENFEENKKVPEIVENMHQYLNDILGEYFIFEHDGFVYEKYITFKYSKRIAGVHPIEKVMTVITPCETLEEELNIINDQMSKTDIFLLCHYERITEKDYEFYISDIPDFLSKTVFEVVDPAEIVVLVDSGNVNWKRMFKPNVLVKKSQFEPSLYSYISFLEETE